MEIRNGAWTGAVYDPTLASAGSSSETSILAAQAEIERAADEARGLETRERATERHAAESRLSAMEDAAREKFRGGMFGAVSSVVGAAASLVSVSGAGADAAKDGASRAAGAGAEQHSVLPRLGRSLGVADEVGGVAKAVFDHRAAEADVRRERAALEESTAADARKSARSDAERAEQRAARQRELVAQIAAERTNTLRSMLRA